MACAMAFLLLLHSIFNERFNFAYYTISYVFVKQKEFRIKNAEFRIDDFFRMAVFIFLTGFTGLTGYILTTEDTKGQEGFLATN